ncbi:hypothetical protein FUA23_20780 [Neolewinella aurantiaca]|uniref:Uncharacterized protein n=1 Tax=Neolewinella aurantiaca TaxID=2602767 RepID=A0A5C7F6P0_9BACT|nr:hypothetical protein [Neolewinella aurantiaca]TXF85240.1 hypothetical protein FUA23_20780 [Neolewinella aurantiaca]
MRLFSRFAVLFSAAFIVMFSAGCDSDTPGTPGGVTLAPVVTLNSGTGLVSFNQELSLSTPSFIVNVSGQDGDASLRDLAILENGTLVPASQLDFRTGETANNPILTSGADAEGFTYEIEITPSNTTAGPVTFTFQLTDVDGEVGSTQVTITYTVTAPVVDLLIEDGFVSGDVTITDRNPSFDVKVLLDDTADPLSTFSVLEDGVLMDASALTFNSGAFTAMNPLTLIEAETAGVTYDVNVRPDVTENSTRTYTFRVADANGITAEQTVTVTYEIPAGTAITFEMGGVFFNASGGMNGGLDLDTGTSVPFNSPDAEIEDEGVNLNAAVGTENWRTQISASNDAILRVANLAGLGDGITFDDIDTKEDITSLYDNGTTPDGSDNFPDADGDVSSTEIVTQVLQEGDVLAIRRADRFYLVRIDAINFEAGSNNDSYTVSIKY